MRIAMITPGFLPAPATKGGAVECLITELLKCNEEKNMINIGEDVWDKYWFGDIVADRRYYEYD